MTKGALANAFATKHGFKQTCIYCHNRCEEGRHLLDPRLVPHQELDVCCLVEVCLLWESYSADLKGEVIGETLLE
jgi:hypothetical protein